MYYRVNNKIVEGYDNKNHASDNKGNNSYILYIIIILIVIILSICIGYKYISF